LAFCTNIANCSFAIPISFFCFASLALAGALAPPVNEFIVIPASIRRTIIVITNAIKVIPFIVSFIFFGH